MQEQWAHGTPRGYKQELCRCIECRAWSAAARRRQRAGHRLRHWWREYVKELWLTDTIAWEQKLEAETAMWETEMREFRQEHPPPRFRDYLIGAAS